MSKLTLKVFGVVSWFEISKGIVAPNDHALATILSKDVAQNDHAWATLSQMDVAQNDHAWATLLQMDLAQDAHAWATILASQGACLTRGIESQKWI